MSGLRAGIVGAGFIGPVHARAARVAGATVAGVAASSPESAQAAREHVGADRAYDDARELVSAPDIDVVHICAPNDLHLPLALAALEAGKHVICEKPVAVDVIGARQLTAAAEDSGLVVAVPFVYRYYPVVREARARVRGGELGELRVIHGAYLQDWQLSAPAGHWRADRERGGPSLTFADIGSHWCDLVEFVTGQRIAALSARTGAMVDEPEQIVVMSFETDAGAIGCAVVSQVSAGRKNQLRFELTGAEESVSFDQEQPETLWVGHPRGTERVPRGTDTLAPEAAAYVTVPAGHPQGYQGCFDAFVAEAYGLMAGASGPDGLPMLADGVRAVELTEAVLESARTGDWVSV